MGKGIRKPIAAHKLERVSLGELIHQYVRVAIETAVHEELHAFLGARRHERCGRRRGYRNGYEGASAVRPDGSPRADVAPRHAVRWRE